MDYNQLATAPPFNKFLDDVLYTEEKDAMLDAMAYTFYREHVADIINVMVGLGANGKSVLAFVLEKLHGEALVSHKSMKDIMTNRFARAGLEGKNLNFTTETARIAYADTAILKEITSNGLQDLERKGVQSYQRRLWAKIWTATNVFPDFDDDSDGMARRLNIFDFPNQFEGDKDDPELKNKLTTPDMLAGIMNMLIPRIKRIAETKRVIMAQKSIAERRRTIRLAKNPLLAFEEDCLREPFPEEMQTKEEPAKNSELKNDAYSAFLAWCAVNKVPKMSEDAFGRAMKNVLGKRDARISIKGKREWFWQDVKLNDFVKLTLLPKL
jgi:putative DNA primase/helicase